MHRIGRIVLLNGPSSAGKSTLGRALLELLPEPWFLFGVDAVGSMRAVERTAELDPEELAAVLRRTRAGYHRAVAGLASAGNDVVMDHALSEPWRLLDLLTVLEAYDVTLVDVRCAPEELERRERERGDRPTGLARSHEVFEHDDRDVVVDTGRAGPTECAEAVAAFLAEPPAERAFDRLRRTRR